MLVLHYTGMTCTREAIDWLVNPKSRVSAHYLVEENGRIVQMVAEERRAWHAGVARWRDVTDVNSASIGIEIANPGHEWGYEPFPEVQMHAVLSLCQDILQRHTVPARNVVGHSDVAPGRKQDPGELFDWRYLAANDVGLWPVACKVHDKHIGPNSPADDVRQLQEDLAGFGYRITVDGVYGGETSNVVVAFQRHFRPERIDRVADSGTLARLEGLLAVLPD